MNSHVVSLIQARINSSRLPAKVILPLGKASLIETVYHRASNTGLNTILATSRSPYDDILCHQLRHTSIRIFRGSLDDVLGRFCEALKDYQDETTVVRLTGDNPVPDGYFIEKVLQEYFEKGLAYLAANGWQAYLPYGVSAEVFQLKDLRLANLHATSKFDREHVTPWIIRHRGKKYATSFKDLDSGHLRCTVDTLEDYQRAFDIFSSINSPNTIRFEDLIKKFESQANNYEPSGVTPSRSKFMVLGTAQIGLKYGINNSIGKPTKTDSLQLMKSSLLAGVRYFDTARVYGDSESIIGQFCDKSNLKPPVITKLTSKIIGCSRSEAQREVDNSLHESLKNLKRDQLDVVMVHSADQLQNGDLGIMDRLIHHKSQGKIERLGLSIQVPDELKFLEQYPDIDLIQIPYNIFDHRWDTELLSQISRDGLEIHVRSLLLQGLLLSEDDDKWSQANVDKNLFNSTMHFLNEIRARSNITSIAEISIRYVLGSDWASGVVVGMESHEQLVQNAEIFNKGTLKPEIIDFIRKNRPNLSSITLNPAKWRVH